MIESDGSEVMRLQYQIPQATHKFAHWITAFAEMSGDCLISSKNMISFE